MFISKQVQHHPPSLMVWAAMSSKNLFGPFFVSGRITSDAYTDLLATRFLPPLKELNLQKKAIFKQDGAPAHKALATRAFLDRHFPDRWIGKFGPTPWPPRSPDLTSCDNALWGIIRKSVNADGATTIAQLEDSIKNAFHAVTPQSLERIHERTWRRIALCTVLDGKQVHPFDK